MLKKFRGKYFSALKTTPGITENIGIGKGWKKKPLSRGLQPAAHGPHAALGRFCAAQEGYFKLNTMRYEY